MTQQQLEDPRANIPDEKASTEDEKREKMIKENEKNIYPETSKRLPSAFLLCDCLQVMQTIQRTVYMI